MLYSLPYYVRIQTLKNRAKEAHLIWDKTTQSTKRQNPYTSEDKQLLLHDPVYALYVLLADPGIGIRVNLSLEVGVAVLA